MLAGVAGVIVLLLLVILVTPVEAELSAVKGADDPAVRVQARIWWLGFRLHSPSRRSVRESAKTRAKAGNRQASIEWSSLISVLRSPGFMRRFVRLVTEELRRTRPRQFELYAHLGFDDPSDTAMFLGWMFALRGHLESPGVRIRLEPDFRDEVFEGKLNVVWSRSVGAMLWPLVRFVASPIVWRAALAARRS